MTMVGPNHLTKRILGVDLGLVDRRATAMAEAGMFQRLSAARPAHSDRRHSTPNPPLSGSVKG
jgi:hypothetical protein